MAAKSPSSHKRTDSGVGGIGPVADTLATAQSFCTAVASLANEHGFQAINDLVKSVPERELEIKIRDKTIRDLRDELAALQKEQDVFNGQQLSNFERKYEKWKEENTALQKEKDKLEAALKEKDSKLIALQSQLVEIEEQVDDLEKENADLTTKIKERGQQLGSLEARLERALADLDGRAEEIEEAHNRTEALQCSLDNEANQHRILKEEASKIRLRLKDFIQFSVRIAELDLADVTVRMAQLWIVATKLVEKFFRRDMPDNVLKSDWTRLRDNDIFKHQIPLPQSNTNAARRMRTAIILGVLTRLVDKFIFQPTYLLDEESGLREILRDEAAIDPVKERYTRGILLSMSPDEQEANGESIVHHVVEQLLDIANARVLLTPEASATFSEALEGFVRQCQEQWKIIQRGKQKLEPSFAYSASSDYPWQLFDDTIADAKDERHSEELSATTAIESDIVLIPRIYHVSTKPDPDPITPGCVLRKTHFDAAAEELRNSLPSAPFTHATSGRHRNRPRRAMSVTGNSKPFLV